MPNFKTDSERKDFRISGKVTRSAGAFLEKLAAKLAKRGKTKKPSNNAALQCAVEYAQAGQKEFGWDEVIDG